MERNGEDEMAESRSGLMRSRQDRMLAGVCGGLANWLGWSPGLVRVLFVLVSLLSAAFPGIVVYLILWLVMPQRDDEDLSIDAL